MLNGDSSFALSHHYANQGSYSVTVAVTDSDGETGLGTAVVDVLNVAPTVGPVTGPTHPLGPNSAAQISTSPPTRASSMGTTPRWTGAMVW